MQRAVIDDSQARAGNGWAIGRRDFLLRELVANYGFIARQCQALAEAEVDKGRVMARLLGSPEIPGPLRRLPRLCGFIWPQGQEGALDFGVLAQLLRWQGEKVASTLEMAVVAQAYQGLAGIEENLRHEEEKLTALLAQATAQLYEVVLVEAGNPLLLRLLLEKPELSVTLWQKELPDLCEELFPLAPETVYLYAAKSYFNGYWLAAALAAFEQALALNPDLEEARRRSFIVRGMLRDQRDREQRK